MYKLSFYVPNNFKEIVKSEIFKVGGGKYQNYDHCCFEILGEGQFRPLKNSKPFIGQENILEKVSEYKVEMIVDVKFIKKVVEKLKEVHPYEEPAFDVIKIETQYL